MNLHPSHSLVLSQPEMGDRSIEGDIASAALDLPQLVAGPVGAVVDDDLAADPEVIPDLVAQLTRNAMTTMTAITKKIRLLTLNAARP